MRSEDRKLRRKREEEKAAYQAEYQSRLQAGFDAAVNKMESDGVELMVRQGLLVPTDIDYEV